jgi:hypothetical protein
MNPVITPSAQAVAVVPSRMTGLASTCSGRNGSGARLSHQANTTVSTIDSAIRPKIVGEIQGTRVPPEVSASKSATAAAIIKLAPMRSSLWARSWRGSRFIELETRSAVMSPSGTLSQKITDQCSRSAMTPPSTGPTTPAAIQAVPI